MVLNYGRAVLFKENFFASFRVQEAGAKRNGSLRYR
jgi:hypothetical protein